jgi:tetratricopeptide (TPR) repeat protein
MGRCHSTGRRLAQWLTMLSDPAALVADKPHDPVAHYQLGLAQLDSGSAAAAASSLRRSLELGYLEDMTAWQNDDPLGPYHAAADALLEAEAFAAAEACYRHSLQLDGQNVAVRERLAATLRLSGRLAEAADELHDTLSLLGEADEEVRCWLLLDLGAVIEDLAPIAGTGADWPSTSSAGASSEAPAVRVGSLGPERLSAEECYRRAVRLDPEAGEAHKRLADVLAYARGAATAQAS